MEINKVSTGGHPDFKPIIDNERIVIINQAFECQDFGEFLLCDDNVKKNCQIQKLCEGEWNKFMERIGSEVCPK